ncbi:MAG: UDP-N-acetylmuramoyl-tripeptide--D-alanyl-D-alanine ligase [Gammaproteobacteria bacterium]
MMELTQIAPLLQGTLLGANAQYLGVSIDTRTLQPNDLFIAIKGPNFDGHDFLTEAQSRGAAAAVVDHLVNCSLPQLQVADTTLALGHLAAHHRSQFNIPMIGITGSCGKTTVRAMTASILQQHSPQPEAVLSSIRSFNNAYGVPLTLLQLTAQHQYAVIEMGTNHFGEIRYLTHIVRPTIAVINNAAAAHLEGLGGSIEGVARAKGEIFEGLAPEGIAVLNVDDPHANYWRTLLLPSQRVLTFSMQHEADFQADNIQLNAGKPTFTLKTPIGAIPVTLPLLGLHNVGNALAAAALSYAASASLTAIQAGLQTVNAVYRRLNEFEAYNGARLIDDSYNANPLSLQAAIETLSTQPGKTILVLGDMRELGDDSIQYHRALGTLARSRGIHRLYGYGDLSQHAIESFGQNAEHFTSHEQLIDALKPILTADCTVLVKGSLSMQMDKVVTALKR